MAPGFVGGPCAVTPDSTHVEVFARGLDQHIHRRVYDGTTWSAWTSLAGLDGSAVNALSDLDCSANTTTIHIVATGTNPLGEYIHAIGFGTVYNAFFREVPSTTFNPSPSITIASSGNLYRMAALAQVVPAFYEVGATPPATQLATPMNMAPVSAPDLAWQPVPAADHTYMVLFDSNGKLVVNDYIVSASPAMWATPILIAPPTATVPYAYTPTVCTETSMGNYYQHLGAVAGGKLYYSVRSSSTFSAWQATNVSVASAPDCTVTEDRTVHMVALTANNTVVDIHRANGAATWTATDLGTY